MKRWTINLLWPLLALAALEARAGEVCSTNVLQTCSSSGSSGTVTGPGAACTDNALARWDGATTTVLQCSDIIVTDGEAVTGVTTLTGVDLIGTTSGCGGGAVDAVNSVCLRSNEIRVEGDAADASELTVAFSVDATADHTLTITGETTNAGVTLRTNDNLINIGGAGTAGSLTFHGTAGTIEGEGTTADAFETQIGFGDAAADRTLYVTAQAATNTVRLSTTAAAPANYIDIRNADVLIGSGSVSHFAVRSDSNVGIDGSVQLVFGSASDPTGSGGIGLSRAAAGVLKVTDGSTGFGVLNAQVLDAREPAAAAGASVAGRTLDVAAGDAVASTDTAGAAAGGALTLATGAAARLTSGNADGGDLKITLGAGIGTGARGTLDFTTSGSVVSAAGGDVFAVFGPSTNAISLGTNSVIFGTAVNSADVGISRSAANVLMVNNSAGSIGALLARLSVETVATTKTPTVTESGELYTNGADTDGQAITLPNDPTAGVCYEFALTAANVATVMSIAANTGETLRQGAVTCGTIYSAAALGSTSRICAVAGGSGGVWQVMSDYPAGAWTCTP